MDNKLSELSKPVGYYRLSEDGVSHYLSSPTEKLDDEVVPLYSQEYVSAMLAELEAKDVRITWLESISTDYISKFQKAQERIAELEAKLSTPVRLPDVLFIKVSGSAVPVMHADRVKERVRAAGFTVERGE